MSGAASSRVAPAERASCELADVFRQYGEASDLLIYEQCVLVEGATLLIAGKGVV